MKRFLVLILSVLLCGICFFVGCKENIDFNEYISEKRTDLYFYADDNLTVKLYNGLRESPYNADGIKGEITPFCEIYCYFKTNPKTVKIKALTVEGEMNYNSIKNCYYLSLGEEIDFGKSVQISLDCDKNSVEFTAQSVIDSATLTCEEALLCAVDHNESLFKGMCKKKVFNGEIFVRLLYDEGCFYYVGVCDKSGKITAYLIDGETGKVIAEKSL
ncbi:MAG: hypothetical protein E7370_06350 [Clostridiales bacterium]|nr:hypothetical protein [Clostridiales bacterium]